MSAIIPSYIAKIARAEKHLIELDAEIERYCSSHPYAVGERMEGKKKPRLVRFLHFTASPANTDIPIIAADAIYNLRSSLDHLMSALAAPKKRSSVIFPVFFEGVWEPTLAGENTERAKQRSRWASDTATIADGAITVLKSLQPPETGWQETDVGLLRLINLLSNRDRHEKLPIIAPGLTSCTVRYETTGGEVKTERASIPQGNVLQDEAEIAGFPDDAVNVQIDGVPLVAINVTHEERYVPLPAKLQGLARYISEVVVPSLVPYVRP